jgi:microcystin-dependent protein
MLRSVSSRVIGSAVAAAALCGAPSTALAQSEPFLGQIMCAGFNFAPKGWAALNGQLLSISQNQALFALLGTQFGGNGQTTFALPDMQGRVMLHPGISPSGTTRVHGETGGSETVSLTAAQMPAHTHGFALPASTGQATGSAPGAAVLATTKGNTKIYAPGPGDTALASASTATAGGGNPVPVMQPFVAINCFIALQGIFPSPN